MIVAQISDTHVTQAGQGVDAEFETARRLREAVQHLMQLPAQPDVVFVTGDCVDGGTVAEYQRFQALLHPLRVPAYVLAGNHDDRENLRHVFGLQGTRNMSDFVQYVVEDWPVRLIALDTTVPGQHHGHLCAQRLSWLDERLAEEPGRPTIVFLHHPPFSLGETALNEMSLQDANNLGAIIARHPQVERVASGHLHCTVQRRFHGTLAVTCPSTAHQLRYDAARPHLFSITVQGAACLLHVWNPSTGLLTHTSYIAPGDRSTTSEVTARTSHLARASHSN